MKRTAILLTLLLFLLVIVPSGVTLAAPPYDRVVRQGDVVNEDITLFGGELVVEEGATVIGEVAVFGGTAAVNGIIDGDLSMFGGTTVLQGNVEGDVVLIGGTMNAGTSSAVDGDCLIVGGTLTGDGKNDLSCSRIGEFSGFTVPAIPSFSESWTISRPSGVARFFGTLGEVAGSSLLLGALALLVAAVAPRQLGEVRAALVRKPAASGVVGFLTAIAGSSLLVLGTLLTVILVFVCIGLLGIPILIAMTVALVAGGLLGWIAAGTILGQRLAVLLKLTNRTLPVTAALGTAVLTLISGLLSNLPFYFGGWLWSLAAIALTCAGLGAVALTRFGTRAYPPLTAADYDKVAGESGHLMIDEVEDIPPK